MARRNRKKTTYGFILPARFAGAVIVTVALALAYIWIECRCEAVGRELKKLEGQVRELDIRLRNEEYRWTSLKSPRNIEHALARHNLVMAWPRRDQVVRIYTDTPGKPARETQVTQTTRRDVRAAGMRGVAFND